MARTPIAAGGAFALASAVAFGATTPLVQRFGREVGPFTTAALLYAGAALLSALLPARGDAPLRGADGGRLLAVALLGSVAAPVALAWGLRRTSGVAASLLLNLEAVFTVTLAHVLWREPVGARVRWALAAMVAGGVLLVVQGLGGTFGAGYGSLAIVGATLAWAADNVVGRPLADRSATQVVVAKGGLGAALSLAIALAVGEHAPSWPPAVALAACGAIGYGASLHLYLRAQRLVGAARTGSIFAAAPFVGAVLARALGDRAAGIATVAGGAFCAIGVWLHLTEAHDHPHVHASVEHDHAHRHDDGHHGHHHDAYPASAHSHGHRHDTLSHSHSHGSDIHHGHEH
ncbi:MAG: DMT family transporter [Myxococcota bacterium]|nr:DMT family transporter [Myxococcota bacterium]